MAAGLLPAPLPQHGEQMRRNRYRQAALAVALAFTVSRSAGAQDSYPQIDVGARLHQQFVWFDNSEYGGAAGMESGFLLRRARIEVDAWLTDRIFLRVQPSFEGGKNRLRLRDAYVEVWLSPPGGSTGLSVRVGQEKRPFGRYELTSSNNLPSIERGAGEGLLDQSSNGLFGDNGFLSHDVGASLQLKTKLGPRGLFVKGGVYNGEGESELDVNASKSFGFRATVDVVSELDVGGSFFSHDGIVTSGAVTDSSFTNQAWGVDAQWGAVGSPGLVVIADYMWGEDATTARVPLRGLSLVGAYHFRLDSSWLYAVEPALRFDRSDPNADVDENETTIMTAGVNFYLSEDAQMRVAYERQSFDAPASPPIGGVRTALTVHF